MKTSKSYKTSIISIIFLGASVSIMAHSYHWFACAMWVSLFMIPYAALDLGFEDSDFSHLYTWAKAYIKNLRKKKEVYTPKNSCIVGDEKE